MAASPSWLAVLAAALGVARVAGLSSVLQLPPAELRPAAPILGMERPVRLGASDLLVSPMGAGTWAWGNKLLWGYDESQNEVLRDGFNAAIESGITWFDSADSYGTGAIEGNAEVLWGDFARNSPSAAGRQAQLFTKFAPYPWRIGAGSIEAACDAALARIGRDQLEVAQLHWPPTLGWQQSAYLDALANLRRTGKARAVGLSNFGPKSLAKVVDEMEARGEAISSNQVQFSLLSRAPGTDERIEEANALGVTIIGYSPLALGLLSGKYSPENPPPGARGQIYRETLPKIAGLLCTMEAVGAERGKTVAQVAINYVLCKGALPLVGVRSRTQAKDNTGALGWRLSDGEVFELERAAMACNADVVQNIFQTP